MTSTIATVRTVPAESESPPIPPDLEVLERARRRQFMATDKLRILEEVDRCSMPGQLGILLRREGLFSGHLTEWRRNCAQGTLAAPAPQRRGQPAPSIDPAEIARRRHENEMVDQREILQLQCEKLRAARDLLLPRLMSGEVSALEPCEE